MKAQLKNCIQEKTRKEKRINPFSIDAKKGGDICIAIATKPKLRINWKERIDSGNQVLAN